ncbi:TonB-dependent receptor [Lysobacter soyae]|uniref:TonB-dependent receptor n=1 Tax=Lysobacter soyae TaxID=2764185 RepID=A0ABX8WRH2_9GAMM|nr:TonB-dependent receptor [Lysobacter sp. CJ11]QYR53437.1 TonB-dependent receptor [Lysobacter sp. CJ11]
MKLNMHLKRSALSVALTLCFAGTLQAQSAVGSVFGQTAANGTVTIENLGTGTKRDINAAADGRFTFSQLAPGNYRVTSNGVTRDVSVKVGTGTQVSFAQASGTFDAITVSADAVRINPIDVSSVESTSVFSAEAINKLPVGREISSVALLAPGTVRGDSGLGSGNLAAFSGASVAENGYYINGFDVTNMRNQLSYADLPFDAIAEEQVKTGGYGAEYGRSLGGVISLVTKRGSNQWKGGATMVYSPSWGREKGRDVDNANADEVATGVKYLAYRSDNRANSWTADIWGAGPIIKDKLFAFVMLQGGRSTSDSYGRTTSNHIEDSSPSGLVKLDWNITDSHILEFTGIYNRNKYNLVEYQNPAGANYTGQHGTVTADRDIENGGKIGILKYTGYFTDNFTLSAQAGWLRSVSGYATPESLPGGNCPRAFDSRANPNTTTYIGCWNQSQTFIRDTKAGPDQDTRRAFRIDGEWVLGDHTLRFGVDDEKYTSTHAGQVYTGGEYWRHYRTGATSRTVNGVVVAPNTNYARRWDSRTTTGSYDVKNSAYYLEDSWKVTDSLLLYIGLRNEAFSNFNSDGEKFIEAKDLVAPRLGFSWDVMGDSTFKVFGNAGRYYIPIATNTNIRASGGEVLIEDFYYTTGVDTATGLPTAVGAHFGPTNVNGSLAAPDPRTLTVTDLKPMYQDEFILGFQKQLNNNWTMGVKGIYREIKSGMDDFCSHQGFVDWARDKGYTNFDYTEMAGCITINPGRDIQLAIDVDGSGNPTVQTVPARYFNLPEYRRHYKGLEFSFERSANDGFYFNGSYTYSMSKGNAEGLVNSTLEQEDPGATQDFDNFLFEDGAFGYLPNDRRHVLKLFGSMKVGQDWNVGLNMLIQSGRPVNCQGYIPLTDPRLGVDRSGLAAYGPSSFYCLAPNGSRYLSNRGAYGRTPWLKTLNLGVSYIPSWADKKLSFKLDVFNLLNSNGVTEYWETTARGSSASPVYDNNFLHPVNYQAPRSLRFMASYEF